MHKSDLAFVFAAQVPYLAKWTLRAWVRLAHLASRPSWADHWAVEKMTETLAYRVPVWTRLGNGQKIRVALNDWIGRRIYEHGYYEPDTVRLVEALLQKDMVVLDVGAHVGQYSLIASRLVGEGGEVHSFEPDPQTFDWLESNARANRLRNVTLNQTAVASDQGPRRLHFSKVRDTGSNSLVEQKDYSRSGRWCVVPCTTLDAYASANGLSRIDFIKADVEGAELGMLQGARGILGAAEPPVLLLEFEEERQRAFGSSCARLAEELDRYGYSLWNVDDRLEPYRPGPGDPPTLNVLAVPPSRQALVSRLAGAISREPPASRR